MAETSSNSETVTAETPAAGVNSYFAIFILTLATFMEYLDATAVNVSLPRIAGDLSSAPNETAWVIGSYLVALAMILPLSGWLATYFGRKNYFMTCVFVFTCSSLMCGLSTSLESLIFFRFVQGLSAGGLAPSEQAIISSTVPPDKLGRAFAIYAFGAGVAPVMGPTFGGWITDTLSWHWIFFVNVPLGIVSLLLVYLFVNEPQKSPEELKKAEKKINSIDWLGIILFAVGIGAFELMLEEGPRGDWFQSDSVWIFAIVSFVSLLIGIAWELYREEPAVDIAMFGHRNFALVCLLIFMISICTFGSLFLVPYMAQTLLDYTAMNAGMIGLPAAIVLLITGPTIGYFLDKFDARRVIFIGAILSIIAIYQLTLINLTVDYYYLATARMFQSFSLSFFSISLNTIGYYDLPPNKNNSVSALLNMARNTGGSIGIALVSTILYQRNQYHANFLTENLSKYNFNFTQTVGNLAQTFQHEGLTKAQSVILANGVIVNTTYKEAGMLSVIDTYFVFITLYLLSIPIIFFLKGKKKKS